MQIGEIANMLNARVLTPTLNAKREVDYTFSSDLMSDLLTREYE